MNRSIDDWFKMYSQLGYTPKQFKDMINIYNAEGVPLESWLKRNWLLEHGYDLKGAENLINWNSGLDTNWGDITMDNYLDDMVNETLGTPINDIYADMNAMKQFPNSYQNSPEIEALSQNNYPNLLNTGGLPVMDDTPHIMSIDKTDAVFNNPKTWSYNGLKNAVDNYGFDYTYDTINDPEIWELLNRLSRKPKY